MSETDSTPVKPEQSLPERRTPHIAGTHSCGARWSRQGAAHCGSCHVTFTSVSGFDAHRRDFTCSDPATLTNSKGTRVELVQRVDAAGCVMWGFPGPADANVFKPTDPVRP